MDRPDRPPGATLPTSRPAAGSSPARRSRRDRALVRRACPCLVRARPAARARPSARPSTRWSSSGRDACARPRHPDHGGRGATRIARIGAGRHGDAPRPQPSSVRRTIAACTGDRRPDVQPDRPAEPRPRDRQRDRDRDRRGARRRRGAHRRCRPARRRQRPGRGRGPRDPRSRSARTPTARACSARRSGSIGCTRS